MNTKHIKISPSLLAADYTRIGEAVAALEAGGTDYIHVDVMDGVFVPTINFGPAMTAAIKRVATRPLDVHLMIVNPAHHIEAFAEAGADAITIHIEDNPHIHRDLLRIRQLNVAPGIAINPGTPISALSEILEFVDLVLVMSVNPGAGGQSFIETTYRRLRELRAMLDAVNPTADISVDGGVSPKNAADIVAAGANMLVAGTGVFKAEGGPAAGVHLLREAAAKGLR